MTVAGSEEKRRHDEMVGAEGGAGGGVKSDRELPAVTLALLEQR